MKKKLSLKLNLEVFLLILFLLISSVFMAFSGGSFILDFKSMAFSVSAGTEKAVYNVSSFVGESVSSVRELWDLKAKYNELTKQLEKDEPKVFSQFLPVGETIHIKVSIITPSATWAGFTDLTVESGDNEAAVKLNKVIASMWPVLFSAIQSAPLAPYTFKLNMSGIPLVITQPGHSTPSNGFFCTRDGKGRLYAAYHDGSNAFEIRRYTAEGNFDTMVDFSGTPLILKALQPT